MDTDQDRRIATRFPAKISLKLSNRENEVSGYAQTIDLSATGLGLVSGEQLCLGEDVDILINIGDQQEQISFRGKVMWCCKSAEHKYRAGITASLELKPVTLIMRSLSTQIKSRHYATFH